MATAVVFRGSVSVEGTAGTFDAIATNATPYTQSAKLTQVWEDEILKDPHGYDGVWMMRNEHATVDLDLYLIATTAAIAAAPVKVVTPGAAAGVALSALGYPLLAPGSILNLSGFALTGFNGVFRVLSGGDASLTNTGAAKYTLKLLKYADATQQTALAVIPT